MKRLVLLAAESPLTAEEEARLAALVPPDRRRQLDRVHNRDIRQQRLLADGLARVLLGAYLGVAPAALRILSAPGGKPMLVDHPALHFNLSHTRDGILCGLSDRPVGVDIERIRLLPDRVAERCFTPAEQALAGGDPFRCLTLWTRKEAAAKWDGRGLSVLRGLDTAGDDWSARLVSGRTGDLVWSVCEEEVGAPSPERLSMTTFWSMVLKETVVT